MGVCLPTFAEKTYSPSASTYLPSNETEKVLNNKSLVSLSTGKHLPAIVSTQGMYTAKAQLDQSVRLHTIHSWYLDIVDKEGDPIHNAELSIKGGMPQHHHGLPTSPKFQEVSVGRYELQGMKFQMLGSWFVDVSVASSAGTDLLRFEFVLDKIH